MTLRLKLASWLLRGTGQVVAPEVAPTSSAPVLSPPPLWVQTLKGWAVVNLMFDEEGQPTGDPRDAITAIATLALTGETTQLNMPSCWMTMQ